MLQQLPIHITSQHVKGHQDEHIPFKLLPRIAQLKILVDTKAKIELEENQQDNLDTTSLTPHQFSFPTILCKKNIIRDQTSDAIYKMIAEEKSQDHGLHANESHQQQTKK